jgi:hypothetical protein
MIKKQLFLFVQEDEPTEKEQNNIQSLMVFIAFAVSFYFDPVHTTHTSTRPAQEGKCYTGRRGRKITRILQLT